MENDIWNTLVDLVDGIYHDNATRELWVVNVMKQTHDDILTIVRNPS